MTLRIDHLLAGGVADLGAHGARSGIDKRPHDGPLWLSQVGLAGDGQADLRFHGGADKALHHYPAEHYGAWRGEMASPRLGPGGFGENLSTTGLVEADVAVGDVFRLGGAVVEVTQGRQPCWKLNLRFGRPDMAARVQASGRMGWYYRVLEPGAVQAGDALVRLERRHAAGPGRADRHGRHAGLAAQLARLRPNTTGDRPGRGLAPAAGDATGLRALTDQRPVHFGGRFWAKASGPSRASAEPKRARTAG